VSVRSMGAFGVAQNGQARRRGRLECCVASLIWKVLLNDRDWRQDLGYGVVYSQRGKVGEGRCPHRRRAPCSGEELPKRLSGDV